MLSTSSVLLLNATGAGTETLKNQILPAVGHFTVVDHENVTERDCGNNFFVTVESIGHPRAQVTSELLKELNPDVQGDFIVAKVDKYVEEEEEKIKKYQLIIASDITNVRLIANIN